MLEATRRVIKRVLKSWFLFIVSFTATFATFAIIRAAINTNERDEFIDGILGIACFIVLTMIAKKLFDGIVPVITTRLMQRVQFARGELVKWSDDGNVDDAWAGLMRDLREHGARWARILRRCFFIIASFVIVYNTITILLTGVTPEPVYIASRVVIVSCMLILIRVAMKILHACAVGVKIDALVSLVTGDERDA